jgi:DNA polymerase-1
MNVKPQGDKACKIAIVGGIPSESDCTSGICFGGRSASYLQQILATSGVSLHNTYRTTVSKASAKDYQFCNVYKGKVTTSPDFEASCAALKEEIESLECNVLVPFGNIALYALTGEWNIEKWRGSVLECTLVKGKKVIPTYNFMEVLTSFTAKEQAKQYILRHDIEKARKHSASPDIPKIKYDFILNPTYLEAIRFLEEEVMKCEMVGFDTEVVRGQVDCMSFAVSPTRCICIPFFGPNGETMPADCEARVWEVAAKVLESPDITKLMQNAAFDMAILFNRYGIECKNVEDTMIAQGLVCPDFPKNLGFISSMYSEQPFYKDDHKDKEGVDWNVVTNYNAFWRYNCIDSAVLLQIYPNILKDLVNYDLVDTYKSHCNLLGPVLYMGARGIKMDTAGMKLEQIECTKRLEEVQLELDKHTGVPLNPLSPKQVMGYFYVTKGIKPYTKRNKDGGSTETVDDDAMKRLVRKGLPEAALVQEYRGIRKYRGTYLEVNIDKDEYLRSNYNPIGTTTGRLSSSETIFGTGTNMQNQPPEMKKFMLIPDGYIGFAPDLAGAETTCVANIGNITAMLDAMKQGLDLHSVTASRLFKIPYKDVSREKGSAGIQGNEASHRDVGKRFNHSGNYGVGFRTLSMRFGWPESDTKQLLEAYHSAYPEVRNSFQAQLLESLKTTRRVWNCVGRSRLFLGSIDKVCEAAFAFPNQSTISDIINRWGLDYIWREPLFEDVILVNQIHDSIEFYVDVRNGYDYAAKVLHALTLNMERPVKWKSREFTIGITPSMMVGNHYNKEEFALGASESETAALLAELHKKLSSKIGGSNHV